MRKLVWLIVVGLFCGGAAAGAVFLVLAATDLDRHTGRRPGRSSSGSRVAAAAVNEPVTRHDEDRRRKSEAIFLDQDKIEDGGFGVASEYTGSIQDHRSLSELREALNARGRVGLAVLQAECDKLVVGVQTPRDAMAHAGRLWYQRGLLEIYVGRFSEASVSFQKSLEIGRSAGIPSRPRSNLMALLGITALRRGEVDNCIGCMGASSCIFPIAREAVHTRQAGSREAIERFTAYLDEWPGDIRIRWLLNLAYMTLGAYPEQVPKKYLIPLDSFQSKLDVGRFENVAPLAGLTSRGPNLAGGSIFDDFTGDGLPDLFTTSLDADSGASLYVNRGDGTFEDRSASAGLDDQIYALNVVRADFDNDGYLDVVLLRGAWENPMRLSLLRNKGNATFEDVTIAAGLADPIATESAAWGDYDNDGLVDLFVCGEYFPPSGDTGTSHPDPPTGAGSITTRGTERSSTSPPRPASSTSSAARGRPGATTTVTAVSISTCRTCTAPLVSIITRAMALSATSLPRSMSREPMSASPAGSGTTTTTAGSTFTSTKTRPASPRRRQSRWA